MYSTKSIQVKLAETKWYDSMSVPKGACFLSGRMWGRGSTPYIHGCNKQGPAACTIKSANETTRTSRSKSYETEL